MSSWSSSETNVEGFLVSSLKNREKDSNQKALHKNEGLFK